ncbi:hypothetical protein GS922_02105 [Rhodococcus hoagii]|nr:hypothetical protein [Prescottella equi]
MSLQTHTTVPVTDVPTDVPDADSAHGHAPVAAGIFSPRQLITSLPARCANSIHATRPATR